MWVRFSPLPSRAGVRLWISLDSWCDFFRFWCPSNSAGTPVDPNFFQDFFKNDDLGIQRVSRPKIFTNQIYTRCFCDGHLFLRRASPFLTDKENPCRGRKNCNFLRNLKFKWYDTCTFPESAHLKHSKSGSKIEFQDFLSKSRSRDLEGFTT